MPETLERQTRSRAARDRGIRLRHYWFEGHRPLRLIVDRILAGDGPDFPFCLCWANENWSRHWDAGNGEVLLRQRYSREDDDEHGRFLLRAMQHPHYLRVAGRPVLFLYRLSWLPDPEATLARWREQWRAEGLEDVEIVAFETTGESEDPARRGADSSAQFIPHGLTERIPGLHPQGVDPGNSVFSYDAVAEHYVQREAAPAWRRHEGIVPGWDNTPRRGDGKSFLLHGSTPERYGQWLQAISARAPQDGMVIVNAWNEWAEGAYLEPDLRHGDAYLRATAHALGVPFAADSPLTLGQEPVVMRDHFAELYLDTLEVHTKLRRRLSRLEATSSARSTSRAMTSSWNSRRSAGRRRCSPERTIDCAVRPESSLPSRYHQTVDPEAVNSAHAMALELPGTTSACSNWARRPVTSRGSWPSATATSSPWSWSPSRHAQLEGIAAVVLQGDLNDPGLLDGLSPDFDVVLAGDVLEHLVNPERVLRRAARLLVPGGRVVVSLPNVAHADVRMALVQGRWDYRPWGLMDRTHLRFFTRVSIEAMLEHVGLVPTDIKRVIIPAFETELAVDRDAIPSELVDLVLADPEAETYQFVFCAVREDEEHHLRRAHEQVRALEAELARTSTAAAAACVERDTLRAELQELRQHQIEDVRPRGDTDRAPAVASGLEAELRAAQAQSEELAGRLRRVEGSVTWQAWRKARGRVVALAGGEDAHTVRGVQAALRWTGRRRTPRRS